MTQQNHEYEAAVDLCAAIGSRPAASVTPEEVKAVIDAIPALISGILDRSNARLEALLADPVFAQATVNGQVAETDPTALLLASDVRAALDADKADLR